MPCRMNVFGRLRPRSARLDQALSKIQGGPMLTHSKFAPAFGMQGDLSIRWKPRCLVLVVGLFAMPMVYAATSNTVLTVNASTVIAGAPLTLTSTTTPSSGTMPSKAVDFYDGSTKIAADVTATSGSTAVAAFSVPTSGAVTGPHSYTATWKGCPSGFLCVAASTSSAVSVSILTQTTTGVVADSPDHRAGQNFTLTATVSGGNPVGTVVFKDSNGPSSSAIQVAGNRATYTTGFATAGQHSFTAVYSGDATTTASTSASPAVVTLAGRDYFIDSGSAGLNTNDGTQAKPWKSFSRLSSVVLSANQSVRLKCGGTWHEQLNLSSSNVSAAGVPAVVSGYGICTPGYRPVIDVGVTLDPLSSSKWTSTRTMPPSAV